MLALALAVGAGLLLAQLLLTPGRRDLQQLAAYLVLSGAATMAIGWLGVRFADHAVGLSLQTKAFLSAAIGGVVGLLNVLIVAQLMFLSTSHDLRLLIALLVFSAIMTLFFSLWVATTVSTRLALITTGIADLAAGRYLSRVMIAGGDEVSRLAADVNDLAYRLQTAERERQELTAAISHDLRTPLASVRAMIEALDDHVVEDPVEVERYYVLMRREIERLNRMIHDLFELAQSDAGAARLNRQPIALQEIAGEVVDAMQAEASRNQVSLSLHVDSEPPLLGLDAARIERALANLLRNALEHTPGGGSINVNVRADAGWAELSVRDTGDGIDAHDLPHIWERFYRAERSRRRGPRAADGAGLGLAIVRCELDLHGGTVSVSSSPGQGATFTVRLPYTDKEQEIGDRGEA